MNYGVVIQQGPQDWQIFQHRDGKAQIHISGCFSLPSSLPDQEKVRVYARIVREDDGFTVIDWTPAQMTDHTFSLTLTDVPLGGLYRLETCMPREGNGWSFEWAVRGDIRHHLGVGDLFVIAGQSNAKGFGREPAYDPPQLGVHLMRQSGRWDLATHPLGDSTDILWPEAEDRSVTGYSPYLSFAKQLYRALGYPIGLIQTAKGASPLQQWAPKDGLLFEGMIKLIQNGGGSITGVLWDQGSSDATEQWSESYLTRFEEMVSALRRNLKSEVVFLTCQLNRQLDGQDDLYWNRIRQAQLDAAKKITGVFVVPTYDLGLSDNIHNSSASVIRLGERLAQVALSRIYRRGNCAIPYLSYMEVLDDHQIRLFFSNIFGGSVSMKWLSRSPEHLPLAVFSEQKRITVSEFLVEREDQILLKTKEVLHGKIVVTVAEGVNPQGRPSYETRSIIPVLAGSVWADR